MSAGGGNDAGELMEQPEYTQISYSIQSLLGIDLSHYKDKQMRRRLDSWLARVGHPDWDTYFSLLRKDPSEQERFRNYITINVSQFFRDPPRWETLRTQVLPDLLHRSNGKDAHIPRLHIWSAGCSIGAETYTLAILLDDLAPGSRHYILGTDIDRGALIRARQGGPYSNEDVRDVPAPFLDRYFTQREGAWTITDQLRSAVQFKEQDLLNDEPEMRFDLIVCRNVVIYFTQATKQMLYRRFAEHLKPGGILFLGGTEIIPRPQEFQLTAQGISLYGRG